MKYYRVEFTFDNYYIVQHRKWGIWRTLYTYREQGDAFMHLDSLHRSELAKRKRFWTKRLRPIRQFLNKRRSQ